MTCPTCPSTRCDRRVSDDGGWACRWLLEHGLLERRAPVVGQNPSTPAADGELQ
jgi:hypothetical protein